MDGTNEECGTKSHLEVAYSFLKEALWWRTLRLSPRTGSAAMFVAESKRLTHQGAKVLRRAK